MILVVIESPLKAPTPEGYERNRRYARACMRDCLARGEAPYASHLLYDQPGILDDTDAQQREQGIVAGLAWGSAAEVRAVYLDLGCSAGMQRGIEAGEALGQRIVRRWLGGEWTP